jgi:hypothetical protein
MSEAMSSVEIEDVLSSIRRLVSEDLRPGPKPVPPSRPDEKLLLTSALRVVGEKDDRPVQSEPVSRAPSSPMPRLHLGTVSAADELAARLQQAVEAQDVEWESEVGDPAPHVAQMEWTEDGWASVDGAAEPEPEALAAEPEPEALAAEPEVPGWAQTDPDQDTVILEADGFDFGIGDPVAMPDERWADRAEAEAVAELQGSKADDAPAPPDAEMTYDEQVLRDLVRDLIREELQGALGERITRNVRKLVRSEIARVLAAQDLE